MNIRSASLLLSCLVLTACSHTTSQPVAPAAPALNVNGTSWMLPIDKEKDCEVPPIIEFDGKTAFGDMGCNRFEAVVTISGNAMRFDNVAATARMCAPGYMRLEGRMKEMLEKTRSAQRTEKGLTFFDAAGKPILTMVPEQAGACN
ncbi:MAG: META domain-containing protein [Duodenibacillus sp.]|nr:META domain-containing protein [Duodenibacillus sp.]